jgi:hypothetical protein
MDYYPPSDHKTLILTVKDILHSLYRLLLHVGEDVRVGVEGLRGVRERRIHRAVVSPSRQVTRVPL